MSNSLNERVIVNHIIDFFSKNYSNFKDLDAQNLQQKIDVYVNQITNVEMQDKEQLNLALSIQFSAYKYLLENQGNAKDLVIIPEQYYRQYQKWFNLPKRDKKDRSSTAIIILSLILFLIFPIVLGAFLIALFLASTLAAAYGLGKDMVECIEELYRHQMIAANLATLAAATACIALTALTLAGIFATSPVGWGVFIGAFMVMASALLVKAVRVITNIVDAYLNSKSALKSDSRFYLSEKDEKNLKEHGFDDKNIEKIKAVVRGLAIKATKTDRLGLFGTKSQYRVIIDLLADIKRGNIPIDIREQYKIDQATAPVTIPIAVV